ncbi:MAG TPA: hypothetical protein VKW78_21970 [Terriglobales bacterium]|nr:hypothetical protein [Terriglobales bacterium]
MSNRETLNELSALLLAQQRMISSLKTEVEALKNMMFDHRPPFREDFERQRAKLTSAKQPGDDMRMRIEAALQRLTGSES